MNHKTQKNLLQYTMMAGTVIAANKTEAQVIYTDIEPDILLYQYVNETEGWGYVDLNSDDISDVGVFLEVGYNCGYCPYWIDFKVNVNLPNEAAVAFDEPCVLSTAYSSDTCYVAGRWLTNFLLEGQEINPGGEFLNNAPERYDSQCGWYGESCIQGFFRGDYGPIDDQFIAIRLIEEDTDYCWIRLRWEGEVLYIKDYACNLNPGEGLIIDIPEPLPLNVETEILQASIITTNNVIQIQSNTSPVNGFIQMVDMNGRLVYASTWDQKNVVIEPDVSPGLYIITLQDAANHYSQQIAIMY
jgi:hypothetical protein